MRKETYFRRVAGAFLICLFSLVFMSWSSILSFAYDASICAEVKIEVRQELTLERQAFDAHMRVNNGLTHITLENVDVDVRFADEDGNSVLASSNPDNTEALFFIRVDSMQNISDVDGSGTVQPSSSADIYWLIIPAPGSSNGLEQGTLYYVGATLTYTIGGEEHVTEVTPDYIFVKPLPELTLDYFLPTDVYGDDAFTSEIEPPVPFSLGVRVKNNGAGVARNMKIDSAQPKIIDNQQGLLIGFVIEGCEVNGEMRSKNLLVKFGDIPPNESAVGRWVMTCSLSGKFIEFDADYSHADELGGELTSLLESVNTHFLVRDVLVDLPGRDSIRDFLGKDGTVYRVYESDSGVTEVVNQSGSSSIELIGQSGSEIHHSLSTPVTAGFMYVQLPDPHNGQKMVKKVVRSDGKYIKLENVWLSKTRNEDHTWKYFINLFDVNTTDSYTVILDDADGSHAPVLQFIPNRSRLEGEQLSFIVEASDPDGTIPSLFVAPLPALATFTDQGDGVGIFDWTPAVGQAGQYTMTFKASDGALEDSQPVVLSIYASGDTDTDGDGMADDWEMLHFGTLARDGKGDYDGDGISDLDEYLNGADPTLGNAPTIPEISSPEVKAEVTAFQPELVIHNSTDSDGDEITYEFELYADETITTLVAGQLNVPEGSQTTSWAAFNALNDNTWYYWRVRATDGTAYSLWQYGSFFVNTENDLPGSFAISSPQDGTEVDILRPTLEVTNSVDIDHDQLTYTFEVYADSNMNTLVASALNIEAGGQGTTRWGIDADLDGHTSYFWRAIATDEHGAQAATPLASFLVNTSNHAPVMTGIASPLSGSEVVTQELDLVVTNASDPDAVELMYLFELDMVNTFDSPAKVTSGEIFEGTDTTSWHVSNLVDNTLYYWRAKASDGFAGSDWVYGNFFVNTANDNPATPTVRNPGPMAWVDTPTPTLEVNRSPDADHDSISYEFELYADAALSNLIAQATSDIGAWVVPSSLDDRNWYYWRARAKDEHDAVSVWTESTTFFFKDNGINDPPHITLVEPSIHVETSGDPVVITWEDMDPDSNATIALYYDTDASGADGTLIVDGLKEDPDGQNDAYVWDISGMACGTYYIYATILDETSSYTSYAQGSITITKEVTLDLPSGWSMVSLPIDATDKRLKAVFPNAVVVYRYERGKGYVRVKADEALTVGKGYWILLDQATTYTIPGQPIESYTHLASEDGWAMIGGCTDLARMLSTGCNVGVIYRYGQGAGYQRVTASQPLEAGEGYWVLLTNVTEGAMITVEADD